MKIRLFIIVVVFVAALVAVVYSSFFPTPAQTTQNPVYFQGLRPGASKSEDAIKTLGQPVREEITASQSSLLVFSSGLGNRPTNVTVDASKTITLVVEPVSPDVTLTSLASELGTPEAVLYGDFARLGFSLFVYLSRGNALLANVTTGEVKERWYFAPTTLEKFKAAFAPAYQDQPVSEGE